MEKTKLKKWQIALIVIVCIAFVWSMLAIVPRVKSVDNNVFVLKKGSQPILIAHGAGNREFPDNTLEACYNAYSVDRNVMLEMDCSITKDGVIIMSHDTTLDYRTSARGNISDWNYSDLMAQKVDFSYLNKKEDGKVVKVVKYTDYNGKQVTPQDVDYPDGVTARDEKIFLATRLIDVLQAFPNNTVNVEIKQSGEIGLKALAEVIRIMEQYDAFDRVVLASFHKEIYQQLKTIRNTTHKDLMFSPEATDIAGLLVTSWIGMDIFYTTPVTVLQVPMSQGPIKVATKAFVNTAHRHNIAVHYWTIDDVDDMKYLISIGADGIMTNLPHKLLEVYNQSK